MTPDENNVGVAEAETAKAAEAETQDRSKLSPTEIDYLRQNIHATSADFHKYNLTADEIAYLRKNVLV